MVEIDGLFDEARIVAFGRRYIYFAETISEARARAQIAGAAPGAETKNSVEARIHDLAREHWLIRNMTVWPMDGATFRKNAGRLTSVISHPTRVGD